MNKRAAILFLAAVAFVAAVLALPKASAMKESRLVKDLPESFGGWVGRPEEPGEREKQVLAKDTEFERMQYFHVDGARPPVQVSIVFSGKNLSQSIHRPEVCLRAQGWEFVSERYLSWENLLPNGERLPVKEIICRIPRFEKGEDGTVEQVLLASGEKAHVWRVFYYTFIGHSKIVSGHYQRTGVDIRDRLFNGYDQRWAYATFSSFLTKKFADQGFETGRLELLDESQTEQHIVDFLSELLPLVVGKPGGETDSLVAGGKALDHE